MPVVEPIRTNTAFLFLKPHACTGGAEDAVSEILLRNRIRIDNHEYMSTEQIVEEDIIDRHYSVISKFATVTPPDRIDLSAAGQHAFEVAFQISWKDAVARGTVLNAKSTASALRLDAQQLGHKWALAQKRCKLGPGLYVTEFPDENVFCINGFYLANRARFAVPGGRIHWYIVSWDEADLSWKEFRAVVVGCTNPAEAPEGSIRRTIYDRWQEFSLKEQPDVSNNGVHASAGPLEALHERMVWLHATLRDDYYANSVLLHGVAESTLTRTLQNPVISTSRGSGAAFDVLEDLQSSEVASVLKEVYEASIRLPVRNSAFVFLKPHAVNHSTKALLEAAFAVNDIRIDYEGEMTSDTIRNRNVIDRHYASIYRYAVQWNPSQIVLSREAMEMFEAKFHIPWPTAVKRGRVFNATDAMLELGDISAKELWLLWSAHESRLKLAPGLYVTYFDEQNMYVLNGFYLDTREKFTCAGAKVAWFCVSWDESNLSWKDFRGRVIGATDPATAVEGSLRATILRQWKDLGLKEPPNVRDNGVHASASPVEALAERHVWLHQRLESDLLCRSAEQQAASSTFLVKWAANPIISLEGREGPAFDLLEDRDASDIIRLARRAEEEAKNCVTENCAFVFIKPHAVTTATIDTVTFHLKERGLRIVREGSIAAEDVGSRGTIDQHYADLAKYAMHVTPDAIPTTASMEEAFYRAFGLRWQDVLYEGRVANAVDACLQLGRVSAEELYQRWSTAEEVTVTKIAPNVYVGYFPSISIFVVNGFYPHIREAYTRPGQRVHWFVVAWPEASLTWADFRAKVIGATNPYDAADDSLRRIILNSWRGLNLSEPPTTLNNGIHASAGPLQALHERRVWLGTELFDDDFAKKALFAGIPSDVLASLCRNPQVVLPDGREGFAFQLLLESQSSACVETLVALYRSVQKKLTRNHAFLFLKPHAVNAAVQILVEERLEANRIVIDDSGSISSEKIYDEQLVDKHYQAIASYAMEVSPARLSLNDEALATFEREFGLSYSTALANGYVLNARDAQMKLGGPGLARRWQDATVKVKLAPSLYVGRIANLEPEDGTPLFVVNGFFPAIREKYTAPGRSIQWFAVSWDEAVLSWRDFRAKVIGATDPDKAEPESLRNLILTRWHELELSAKPTMSDNGIHASAGPLEGIKERNIWLGQDVEKDPIGAALIMNGMDRDVLYALLNNPVVDLRDRRGAVFDLLEDTQTSQAALELLDIQNLLTTDQSLQFSAQSQDNDEEKADASEGTPPGKESNSAGKSTGGAGVGETTALPPSRLGKLSKPTGPVSSFRARNSAFLFIKPHALTSGVVALLEVVLKDHHIRIDMQGEMTSDEIFQRRLIDKHYRTIHRYAEAWTADKVKLSAASQEVFLKTFHIPWLSAVADHLVFNASDAAKLLKLTPEGMQQKWDSAVTKTKVAPGLYIARFLDEDMYVMNGFYLLNREKYVMAGQRVRWYVVSWSEHEMTWRQFREGVIGPTDPETALADTLRGAIYREFANLGLRKAPTVADNGIHASAGPLEACYERSVWLGTKLTEDGFAKLALQRGSSTVVLQHWMTNPIVKVRASSVPWRNPSTTSADGALVTEIESHAFDLLEDTQTTDALSVLVAAEEARKAAPPVNTAFVFVKPHAINRYVHGLVEAALRENKIDIIRDGEVHGDEIAAKGLVDKQYGDSSRYAMERSAASLAISEGAQNRFREVYGVAWTEAVQGNVVYNAVEACASLGNIDGTELNRRWEVYVNRVTLAPGLEVAEFTDEGIYVLNGYYLAHRQKYLDPKARIHYYVVSWNERDLSWKDFRSRIIGGSNPQTANSASLRSTLFRQWEAIGLYKCPDVLDNGVHASAGPLEGLAERLLWLGTPLEEDPFGQTLLANGVNGELLHDWMATNPPLTLPGVPSRESLSPQRNRAAAAASSSSSEGYALTRHVFDQLEDLQSSQVVAILREACKLYGSPQRKKGGGPGSAHPRASSPSSSSHAGAPLDLDELAEAERLKGTNCAFFYIKPHAATKQVLSLVQSVFQVNGLHVEQSGVLHAYDMEKRNLVDLHYHLLARNALEWKATTHKLNADQMSQFYDAFHVHWNDALREAKILNAADAALALGHLSPQQLAKRWILSPKRIKLAPGFFVARFDEDDLFVINGFYPLTREKYYLPERKIMWFVLSWKETQLSWFDFRERVVGATNPAEAEAGSLRNAVLQDWRNMELDAAPNVADNVVHASASPLEGLRERMIWLDAKLEADLFGRALTLAGCNLDLVRRWCENPFVQIDSLNELKGYAFDVVENKQSSEVVNMLSDATAELIFAPIKLSSVTPKRKLFQVAMRDMFINAVTEEELRELFRLYDPNDTGLIDREKFKEEFLQMEQFGLAVNKYELNRLFAKRSAASPDEGKMTFEEFTLVMMARQRI